MLKFSELISAVKPKERTTQYILLTALYSLDAHNKSIGTREVTKLLAEQLPKKQLPKNTSTSLKKYTGYVDSRLKGSQRLWSLTRKGLDRLRILSGLALESPVRASDFGTDVGIICALEDELEAVITATGGPKKWKDVGDARFAHVYRRTTLELDSGTTINVVATTSTSMGLTAAAIATTQMILQYHPRLVVMVGITAGTSSGNKQFGDVLVADPSVDYNSGKIEEVDGTRKLLPDPYPIGLNTRLRSLLNKYCRNHIIFNTIRNRWGGSLPKAANRLHLGPLGAADQVINDAKFIEEIQGNWRKLIGVEMETYGVYRACYEAPEPKPRFVSFKSVCDFAAQKDDSWQAYAAFTAAEFTKEFLKAEWSSIWPPSD